MAVFKSAFAGGNRNQGQGGGVAGQHISGINFHHFSVNVPTAALDSTDEQILLWKFPDDSDCWLLRSGSNTTTTPLLGSDFSVAVTDLDGGTDLDWDLGIGDVDGVIDTLLIEASTVGQSAGSDYLDAIAEPLDVTGKYLIWDNTAAVSSPTAGTLTIRMRVAYGVKLEADTGVA